MSKRSGNYLTLKDVYNEVGSDALRFMMISRDARSTIDFDFQSVQEKIKIIQYFMFNMLMQDANLYLKFFKKTLN